MDETSQKQNYELAFHITPNVDEAKALQIKDELEQFVISKGGTVSFARTPERTHLSYPIKHEQYAYFGYLHFSLYDSAALVAIEEHLKLNGDIIRHLTLRMQTDEEKQRAMRRSAAHQEGRERRAQKEKQAATEPTGRSEVSAKITPEKTEPVPESTIEKQIEEIIEGL